MAILKGHKMALGLDPGCDITYKIILIQCFLHILAFVQLAHHFEPWVPVSEPQIPCPNLQLKNGQVDTTKGRIVTFVCDKGFILMGKDMLTCGESGKWNGYMPNCISK